MEFGYCHIAIAKIANKIDIVAYLLKIFRKTSFPIHMPPSCSGIASGVDLGHDGLVVLLVNLYSVATALEEDDEIEAACNASHWIFMRFMF
jgi:hypothetical protein